MTTEEQNLAFTENTLEVLDRSIVEYEVELTKIEQLAAQKKLEIAYGKLQRAKVLRALRKMGVLTAPEEDAP